MYLLSGQSLTKADWFRPEKMPLNLEERLSTATLTLGPEAPEIQVGAWLLDDEEPGAGIVWLVKTINTQYDTKTRTVTLEHISATLKDVIMFGQVKPTDMRASGSTAPAGKCYAAEALAYILSKHSQWTLGTVDSAYSSVSNPYNFNGDTLFAALETVTASLGGCYWEFDLSTIPFRISFLQESDDIDSEMRMGRNITTMRKTVDKSRMYTRFYPIGKSDLHITGDYVSRNENTYGRKDKTETDQSKTTEAELIAWANERLDKHAEPAVTITISGLELSESTGESLDHLVINKKCRVPLPEYGTTIVEKVTKLSWGDKIGAPEAVTATLANLIEDLASIINNANAASSRGGRASATQAKEDHAWFEDTDDHVAMVAEAVAGTDEQGNPNWSRVASLLVDGNGIEARVTVAENGAVTATSWITQNESAILQGVQDASGAKSWIDQNGSTVTAGVAQIGSLQAKDVELEGRLDIEAGKASLLVSATDAREILTYQNQASFPTTGDANKLYYSLANKKYYEWKNGAYSETTPGNTINRAGIIATINQDGSSTTSILGSKVLIGFNDQQLTDEDLNSWAADAKNGTGVFAKFLTVKRLTAQEISTMLADIGNAEIGVMDVGDLYADQLVVDGDMTADTINQNSLDDFIADATVSGNTLTLTKVSGDTVTVNFNGATTLSGVWSGRIFTVTASPQGTTKSGIVYNTLVPDTSIPVAKSGKNVRRTFIVYSDDGEGNADKTLFSNEVSIDASSVWDDGFSAGAPTDVLLGTKVTGTVWNVAAMRGNGTTFADTLDLASVYSDARAGYYTAAQYNANYTTGYNNGAPTDVLLGTKVTGSVWNVAATRGDGTTFADTLDLASVYSDARAGYYTAAQYNANYTTGYNNGAPTDVLLGTKVTGTVWNVTAKRGDNTSYADTLDLGSVYTDARDGYYTASEYNAAYETGWKAGWRAYYDDSIDWYPSSQHPNWTGKAWIPKRNADLFYSRGGHGDGSSTYCEEWSAVETPSGGSNPYPQTKTMTCTAAIFTQGQWRYEFYYTMSNANEFVTGSTYKFHNNSSYT